MSGMRGIGLPAELHARFPTWLLAAALTGGLLVFGLLAHEEWSRWTEAKRLRDENLAACIERLGSAACEQHLAAYHEDCARITRIHGGRGGHSGPDPEAYLDCVVLTPEGLMARRVEEHRRNARERREALSPR